MKIRETVTTGFIGFYLEQKLLERGDKGIGLDNLNNYNDKKIKCKGFN